MFLKEIHALHHYRKGFQKNPLLGGNFVFIERQDKEGLAAQMADIEAKKKEIEALEQKFHDAIGDTFERYHIKGQIDEAKRQLKALEQADFVKTNMLQNGLGNNVSALRRELNNLDLEEERELDLNKREAIFVQKKVLNKEIEASEKTLGERLKPVKSLKDIDDAKDQIRRDDHLLKKIGAGTLDRIDLELLFTSDLLPFFDSKFKERLKKESEGLGRVENIYAGRDQVLNVVEGAEKDWLEYAKNSQTAINQLKIEEAGLEKTFKNSKDKREKERIERRLREVKDEILYTTLDLENGRREWIERRKREQENQPRKGAFNLIDTETLNHLRQVITEAKDLRLGKIHEYLETEFNKVDKQFETFKGNKAISTKTVTELAERISEAKLLLLDRSIEDPNVLKQLAQNFKETKARMAKFEVEINMIEALRPTLEQKAKARFGRLKGAIAKIPKADIEAAKQELLTQAKVNGKTPANSPILKKELEGLDFLSGQGSLKIENGEFDLEKSISTLEQKLENFSQMSNEEIRAFNLDLDTYTRLITDRVDANKSHEIIGKLEQKETLEEIRPLLEKELGKEHLSVVDHKQFANDYKQYTQEGYMVFYQRGDEWKIIIDKDAFEASGETKEKTIKRVQILKAQITHELLHLEFEKNHALKDQVRQEMVEANPEAWKKIKAAFLEMAKAHSKSSPLGGQNWTDDHILSELFAMQNELGKVPSSTNPEWAKENPTKAKLNDLLFQQNILDESPGLKELREKYKEEDITVHGSETGLMLDDQHSKRVVESRGPDPNKEPASVGEARYESNKADIDQNKSLLKELANSEYVGQITGGQDTVNKMSIFNERTEQLNEQLKDNPSDAALAQTILNRIKDIKEDVFKFNDELRGVTTNLPNTQMSFFRRMWINTRFLSLADIVKMGSDLQEYMGRRLTRRNEDNAAALGMALFTGSNLGSEFRARQQKSEAGEVQEWQSRYPNLDGWQMLEELRAISFSLSPNKDQLKAILRLIADKGRLEWTSEDLWRALNKLQSSAEFIPGDETLKRNPILLREKMQLALGEIFDNDEYPSLERSNLSAYDGNKSKYAPVHDRMPNLLTKRLDEILAQHRGKGNADPMLYESILEDCMTKGRSYGENVMFHLIAGMAYGLLAPDRGLALSSKLANNWPPIEWFGTIKPPPIEKDWKDLCEANFKEAFEKGSIDGNEGEAFKSWFWTTVQMNKMVIDRAKKSVGERGWDHDWGRTIVCLGDGDTAQRFFQGRGGQKETKPTAVGNTIAGMVQMLEENALNRKNASKEEFARIASIIAMTEGILNGTAFNSPGDTYTRETSEINNAKPREGGIGRHANKTTREHRDINLSFLKMLDEELFGNILKGEVILPPDKQKLGRDAAAYISQKYPGLAKSMEDVKEIDQIYNRIGLITKHILDNMSPDKFEEILDKIAAEARGT